MENQITEIQRAEWIMRNRNRRTGYELVARHPDGRAHVIAYCDSKSRRFLYKVLCKRGDRLAKLTGSDSINFAMRAEDGGTMGAWSIVWSGRTQYQIVCERLPLLSGLPE